MKYVLVCVLILASCFQFSEQLRNLLNSNIHECIKCLCHARTGCFNRKTCASYSITRTYWETAGYPALAGDDPDDSQSYNKCMNNENCILNTIVGYTETFDKLDCNCDGTYDCQDMLKLHLYGEKCGRVMDSNMMNRFNNCARGSNLHKITSNTVCQVIAQ